MNHFKKPLLFLQLASGLSILMLVYLIYASIPKNEQSPNEESKEYIPVDPNFNHVWTAPSEWRLNKLPIEQKDMIIYGKELIQNTAAYLGPKGSVKPISNGLNCQNCHLNAGAQPWGNNYFAVASTYPKIRKRSGKMTSIQDRINGCFQRSLNGLPLDTNTYEMKSMVAYMKWLGEDVMPGKTPIGSKVFPIAILDRAADPIKGKSIYVEKCVICHQEDGQGVKNPDGKTYAYPPLWGPHSYNDGAGLYRISKFAGYVRYNMPFGADYTNPQLSEEESWDVAAYVNSMPRPTKDKSKDWPNMADKPMDHPFGPFADPYSEEQHKYGPYQPILDFYSKK